MALNKRYDTHNYKTASLKYGFFTGMLLSLIVIFRYLFESPLKGPTGYIENIALLILMFLFTYLYRRKLKEQPFSFKQAYLLNLFMGIVASIIYGVFIVIYAQYIDTDFSVRYIVQQEAVAIQQGEPLTGEELARMGSANNLGSMAFVLTAILSIVFALFVALAFRTQKKLRIKS